MALPNFLIIGAMKSATSSLHRDLETHPDVSFGMRKEPSSLSSPDVLTARGRRRYEALYVKCVSGQRIGDASTSYSKLPEFTGAPQRARQLLGPDIRIIYSVRDPMARALSHHHHLYVRNRVPRAFEAALECVPGIRDFGLYAMQLAAWTAEFPREQIKVVRFEDYVVNPRTVLDDIVEFLGLPAGMAMPGEPVHVTTKVRPLSKRQVGLRNNRVYRRVVRPLLPQSIRQRVTLERHPESVVRPDPPLPATRDALLRIFAQDTLRLAEMLDIRGPLWSSP